MSFWNNSHPIRQKKSHKTTNILQEICLVHDQNEEFLHLMLKCLWFVSFCLCRLMNELHRLVGSVPPCVFLSVYLFPRLPTGLYSKSNLRLSASTTKSLLHASLSERLAFISVMDRWTPREICLLLSHLVNSFHGLSEKRETKCGAFMGAGGESGSDPPIWPHRVPTL